MQKTTFILLLFLAFSVVSVGQKPKTTAKSETAATQTLDEKIKAVMENFSGKILIYAKNLVLDKIGTDTANDFMDMLGPGRRTVCEKFSAAAIRGLTWMRV